MRCLLALTVYHTPRQRGALFVCFSLFITVTPRIRKGTSAGTPFVYGTTVVTVCSTRVCRRSNTITACESQCHDVYLQNVYEILE